MTVTASSALPRSAKHCTWTDLAPVGHLEAYLSDSPPHIVSDHAHLLLPLPIEAEVHQRLVLHWHRQCPGQQEVQVPVQLGPGGLPARLDVDLAVRGDGHPDVAVAHVGDVGGGVVVGVVAGSLPGMWGSDW